MESASPKKSVLVPLLQRFRGLRLASFADGALLSSARVLSEGAIVEGEGGERVYAGSTMLTIDVSGGTVPGVDRGGASDAELLEAVRRSLGFHVRAIRLARAEAERRSAPYLLREMRNELAFRIEGGVLFVDIDVECPVAVPWKGADETQRGAP
jgi:hypothetical protein